MENIVEIVDLSKDYETGFWRKKKSRALDGLNLTVHSGQIFGFLGGNGAGKTTTIKILMGLLFPTSGSAKILGKNISDVDMHRHIGYCPENPYFYDYLTARELLNYFGELFELDKSTRRSRTEDLLDRVGLAEEARNRQLRKFSKGMQQRVGLAQSLINDPQIVFLDEPMSGLDPSGRREIRELIAGLRENGKTVFMSTHILSDVEALCDEVAILRNGKLAATGKLDDLLARQATTQSFEINISGVSVEQISAKLKTIKQSTSSPAVNGARVLVADEKDIEAVIQIARENKGKILSVLPVRQSLEELFVEKTTDGAR